MAETPVKAESLGDPYQDTDQDEPMDTDSEHDSGTRIDNPEGADLIPDNDSERMEISDNENSDEDEAERTLPNHNASATTSNQMTSISVGANSSIVLPGSTKSAIQTGHVSSSSIRPSRRLSPMLQDIHDLRELVHGLPVPVWQKVFVAVPPASLGQLLACTRLFHAILAPRLPVELEFQQRFQQDPDFLSGESIWQASRNRFASDMPKPLIGKSELDMWRLIRGTTCQVCRQRKPLTTSHGSADPWHSGPGSEGMRVIWPCGVRICATCLLQRCQQEISLQLSSTFPSFLIQALPAILLSQYNDWIPEPVLLSRPPSPHLQIRKLYYQPQIDSVLLQFRNVRELGEAAAEEWIKGLDRQRSDILADANRWEQWEMKGGLKKVDVHYRPKSLPPVPPAVALPHGPPPTPFPPAVMMPPVANFQEQNFPPYQPHGHGPIMPPVPYPGPPQPPGFNQFQPPMFMPGPNGPAGRPRRTLQEVNEARAARRREIERRSLELDPPIGPKVLAHMQSFQAALQISFPFTDKDWEVLKPRLLAQREAAEAQEAVLAEQLRAIQTTAARPSLDALLAKDPNEMTEDHWELLQAPLREKLGQFADESIKGVWEGGSGLTPETAPHFVADVLLTACNKYRESIAQPSGGSEPTIPRIPVSLESMKWLYDNKLKNVAEVYQKDLFVCNGCDANSKLYGFEGVLQHYAAKHTTDLSLGNVIVNWRAEWPDVSPFAPYRRPEDKDASEHTGYQSGPAADGSHSSAQYMAYQNPAFPYGSLGQGNQYPNWPSGEGSSGNQFSGQPGSYGRQNENTAASGLDRSLAVSQFPFVPTSPNSDTHRQQLAEMAQISRDLWNATMGIKELQPSVRVRVLIKHMSTRFEKKFNKRPDVSMFLHGLNENSQMRPIRSLNGLTCKACGLHSPMDRKSFTLPALVNHFKNMHLSSAEGSSESSTLDWRVDMVEVPENSAIEKLVTSNGMDDRKFQLIAATFPDAFPSPLPLLSTLKESKAKEEANRIRLENLGALKPEPSRVNSQEQPRPVHDEPYREEYRPVGRRHSSPRRSMESDKESAIVADEDEYDPSVPSFVGEIVAKSGFPRNVGFQQSASVRLPPGIISLGVVDEKDQPQSPHTQGGYADRLLRHHRGLPRRAAESEIVERNPYPDFGHNGEFKHEDGISSGSLTAEQFLHKLAASRSVQHNQDISNNNRYTALDENGARQSGAVRPSRMDLMLEASQPVDYRGTSSTADLRHSSRQYPEEPFRRGPSESQWDNPPSRMEHSAHHYHNRDRSRSPRRSIPRDHTGYDPNVPSPLFEERFDMRWRGEAAPRGHVYRANPEPVYGIGPGSDFIARDAHGRNVRYIAMPVEEYEAQTRRYVPADSAIPSDMQYTTRSAEAMDGRPEGGLYVIGERDPVRYVDGSMERHYRDYPPR